MKHVVTLSIADFFPTLKKMLLGFVLKRVRKVIPNMTTQNTRFADALAMGRKHRGGADVRAYTKGITGKSVALYQYTSGTTGRSKGASLSHHAVLTNAEQARLMTVSVLKEGEEVALVALPLYHITAFVLLFVSG